MGEMFRSMPTDLCERKPRVETAADLCERKPRVELTYKTFAGGVVAALAAGAPIKTQNSFAALSLLTDDTDALLGAVSGDVSGGQVVEPSSTRGRCTP